MSSIALKRVPYKTSLRTPPSLSGGSGSIPKTIFISLETEPRVKCITAHCAATSHNAACQIQPMINLYPPPFSEGGAGVKVLRKEIATLAT